MKTPIMDISSLIYHTENEEKIYIVTLKFGVLEFRLKLTSSDLFDFLLSVIQGKEISFRTQIYCPPLQQDRRKKYFEIGDETFNPRMIEEEE